MSYLKLFGIGLMIIGLGGCQVKLVTAYEETMTRPVALHEPFGIIESDTVIIPAEAKFLGTIDVQSGAFSVDCGEFTVRKKLYDEARRVGANLVDIRRHLTPETMGNPCHRMFARVYHMEDPRPYEEFVFWFPERKLTYEDFRADTVNRPFLASTQSGMFYYMQSVPPSNQLMIIARARFHPELSYFKRSGVDTVDSAVLEHEQLHFDISEIYARKLYKRLMALDYNRADLSATASPVLEELTKQLHVKQDEYDSDVYEHPEHQAKWRLWVEEELQRYADYADKEGIH